jgi:hypothetical protein
VRHKVRRVAHLREQEGKDNQERSKVTAHGQILSALMA